MNNYYQQFNQALADGLTRMGSPVSTTSPDTAQPIPETDLTGKGSLVVQVTLAKGAIPVEGANVTVTETKSSSPIATLVTDKSGQTKPLFLPAPSAEFSQTPNGSIRPYSIYNIKIEFPGYYVEEAINVPIFDKINSIQPVSLVPLPENQSGQTNNEIIIDESRQGPNL